MTRAIRLAVTLCAVIAAGAAAAAPQPDELKQLCERICGGAWESTEVPVPDQFVVTYTYQWDERLDLVRGTQVTVGGVGGIHREADIFFGRDPQSGTLWTATIRSDGPAIYGTFSLGSDGYQTVERPLGGGDSKMISSYAFSGPDAYTETNEILTATQATRGVPRDWRRVTTP